MKLTERYTERQEKYLKKLQEIGAILDVAIFFIEEEPENTYQVSFEAAVNAMDIFAERLVESQLKLKERKGFEHINIDKLFKIKKHPNVLPKGSIIPFDIFVGKGLVPSQNMKNYFTVDPGLKHALLDPPYNLQLNTILKNNETREEAGEKLLNGFLSAILHIQHPADSKNMTIYRWSDDWSNYFDDGKEWWGTYYWTVYDAINKQVTVIGASSTD